MLKCIVIMVDILELILFFEDVDVNEHQSPVFAVEVKASLGGHLRDYFSCYLPDAQPRNR